MTDKNKAIRANQVAISEHRTSILTMFDMQAAFETRLQALEKPPTRTPLPQPDPAPTPTPGKLSMGIGLPTMRNWSNAWVFANVYLQSERTKVEGGWIHHSVFLDVKPHYLSGVYTVLWDGGGEVKGVRSGKSSIVDWDMGPNSGWFTVNPSQGSAIRYACRGDVRNLRIMYPSYGPSEQRDGEQFHAKFLELLKPFSVIRFMDWQRTNSSTTVSWDQRTPASGLQTLSDGVSVEWMVELCNTLNIDPWFCMPHLADDNYVRQFATLVKRMLNPNLTPHIEWSNEVWNGQLGNQNDWVREEALRRGWTHGSDNRPDPKRVWAERMANTFRIWREVFGDRVIRVVAGQENGPHVVERLLEELGDNFDAIAISAYVGNKVNVDQSLDGIASDMLAQLGPDGSRGKNRRKHGVIARRESVRLGREIPLLAYEAGQHLDKNDPGSAEIQRDERMFDILTANAKDFKEAGGSLYCAYHLMRGHFGHLANMNDTNPLPPKYRALLEWGG